MKAFVSGVTFLSSLAAASLIRDEAINYKCRTNPNGTAPISNPYSADAFLADPEYSYLANNASAPDGFTKSFADMNASVQDPSYLGVHTLQSYDTEACKTHCEQEKDCLSFNVYVVRTPSVVWICSSMASPLPSPSPLFF